jgi:hypothetical protein
LLTLYEAWLELNVDGKAYHFQIPRKDGSPMWLTQGSAEKAVLRDLQNAHKGYVIKREVIFERPGSLKEVPQKLKEDLRSMKDPAGDLFNDREFPPAPDGSKDDII